MSSLEEIRAERERKRELLKQAGMDPYALRSDRTHTIKEVEEQFGSLSDEGKAVTIAGRTMSLRRHGGSAFADLFDGSGEIQAFFSKDAIGEDSFSLFTDAIDPSDFIEVKGTAFTTKQNARAIAVKEWHVLTKAIQAVPSEFYGIKDTEERLRKRYLDILLNKDARNMIAQKAHFWRVIRRFLEDRGYLEVETPTLEVTTGGAEATPFKTHHNDLDIDVFLRISMGELWQKRLMAAGIPKTFEIGRVYRNEGSSPEHTQEFTNMECYTAYLNFEEGKVLVQDLYRTVAQEVFGQTSFTTRGHTFDLADEWEELDYVSTVESIAGLNVLEASEKDLQSKLKELSVEHEGTTRERMTDALWKYCRRQISGPAFLVNHPKFMAPLSKTHPDDERLTKKLQVVLAGSEVGTGYAELNDPKEQRRRFEKQQALIEQGDTEAMMPEWDFVEMLEFGMPPTFGFGVGDRLFAFLIDKPLRETQLFPLMRPK